MNYVIEMYLHLTENIIQDQKDELSMCMHTNSLRTQENPTLSHWKSSNISWQVKFYNNKYTGSLQVCTKIIDIFSFLSKNVINI